MSTVVDISVLRGNIIQTEQRQKTKLMIQRLTASRCVPTSIVHGVTNENLQNLH